MIALRTLCIVAAAPVAAGAAPGGKTIPASTRSARADLADQAQGTYIGEIISDARGSSHSGVRITVTKIGRNKVRVAADYDRLPAFESSLARYLQTVQNNGGDAIFLLDLSKNPAALSVTVDDASWAGFKN